MRRPLIIGKWKMNTTLADATVLAEQVKNAARSLEEVEIVLSPPFIWLVSLAEILEKAPSNLSLGAQNMWFAEKGAMTGEVSPLMLKGIVDYVILGHSERRQHFHESDELINDKVHAAYDHKLKPIVCVGEEKKMEETGRSKVEVGTGVIHQLEKALEGINADKAEELIVAYEPIWAIGTGNAATGAYAASVIGRLRDVIAKKYGQNIADRVRILYGGSVTAENIQEFIYQPEIDGALVGGASLKAKDFIEVCKEAAGQQ